MNNYFDTLIYEIELNKTEMLNRLEITYPSILEGSLAHFLGLLFEFLNSTFIDATAFINEVSGGG